MKKLFLTIAVVSAFTAVSFAQKVNVQSYKDKIAKATADTQDPKKGIKASAWIALGDAYVNAANAYTMDVYQGMQEVEMIGFLGRPESESIPVEKIGGVDYKHYSYPGVDLYFTMEGALELFLQKSPIVEDALSQALAAYNKALEVDPKAASKVKDSLKKLVTAGRAEGANAYSLGKFDLASKDFSAAAQAATSPALNDETANELLFFAAVTSLQSENFEQGAKLLEMLKDKGEYRNGDVYNYLGIAYTKLEKNDKVESTLIEGLEKFQSNQGILNSLISYYISANEDPSKVIPYIKKAQEDNPKDANLHIAEGLAYENMQDTPKAIEAYGVAVQLDPTLFDGLYNYGLATYRLAGDLIKALSAIDLSNQTELDKKESEAIEMFKVAAERMEKAHAVTPDNRDAIEVLRSIYFRLSGNRLTKDNKTYSEKYTQYKDLLQK